MMLFYKIMTKMRRNFNSAYCSSSQFQKISQSVEYMNSHFLDPDFEIGCLAEYSGVSSSYFKKIFIKNFGTSPKQYLIAKRMNYARDLLLDGKMSVTEISESVGYSNICYFSQAFKRFWGSSPQNYIDTFKMQVENPERTDRE